MWSTNVSVISLLRLGISQMTFPNHGHKKQKRRWNYWAFSNFQETKTVSSKLAWFVAVFWGESAGRSEVTKGIWRGIAHVIFTVVICPVCHIAEDAEVEASHEKNLSDATGNNNRHLMQIMKESNTKSSANYTVAIHPI